MAAGGAVADAELRETADWLAAGGADAERAAADLAAFSNADASGTGEVTVEINDREFVLAVEVIYHRSRQAFLAGAHRWSMFAAILAGASAAAPLAPTVSGLVAAAFGAADIAFDFTGRSQKHGDFARRYLALAARDATDEEFRHEWLALSADEPETYRLAQILAHNHACESLGRGEKVTLTFWQRLRAHVWRA